MSNLSIYKWGSRYGRNDWCFVRKPMNYDHQGVPHELVVLNHGNGWTMDGTEATANFSSKTQFGVDSQNGGTYLDTARADYVQYSSPLIEALLAEGFVVVGAQNDGDSYGSGNAGYGNNETRQNIADFVRHCQRNLNVTDYCHMIGASNGALATLNAAMIMPLGAIRSITLLYPMISLVSAWNSHKIGVDQAYGVTSSFTDMQNKTRGHDPMSHLTFRASVLSGNDEISHGEDSTTATTKYKVTAFPWPRIFAVYSHEDTVTPYSSHWGLFRALLIRSRCEFKEEAVIGQHGSWQHFSGINEIIDWMRK